MSNAEVLRQRIKYVVEHGELYPVGHPVDKPFAVKLCLIIMSLQVIDTVINLWLFFAS